MLGRFTFTSSFSRRSSPGLSKGLTRFGFWFCESVPLSIFVISYQSIHYSQFEAATLAARSIAAPIRVPFPRDVAHHSYGSVLAPIICSLGARRFPSPSPHPSHRDTSIPVDPRLFGLSKPSRSASQSVVHSTALKIWRYQARRSCRAWDWGQWSRH